MKTLDSMRLAKELLADDPITKETAAAMVQWLQQLMRDCEVLPGVHQYNFPIRLTLEEKT